ncbi:MAG: 16S rRNA (guanine(966)-N(2))-methyltransferase RsmD [Candidatus Omnitrophota bacterium]|nr:16S rRNA (guanine(966)-N(2))-methyltransferase RsmD [Candidatus Omnitrophota bacterium]
MRITAGKYKSRIIYAPKGIRPTEEILRKAFFDILGDIEGLSFLEFFAGSGAVGLEAISRGAKDLSLVEYDPDCLAVIRKNIDSLKGSACSIYPQEAEHALRLLYASGQRFDIIFMDPPYYKGENPRLNGMQGGSLAKKILQSLSQYDILKHRGLIAIQHFKKDVLPKTEGNIHLIKQARYSDSLLSLYRKKEDEQ